MPWRRLPLLAEFDEETEALWRSAWELACEGTASDAGNAVFGQSMGAAGTMLYFTPSAEELADTFGAKPCDKPAAADLVQVAGDARAWETHFPGQSPAVASTGRRYAGLSRPFVPTQPLPRPPSAPAPLG